MTDAPQLVEVRVIGIPLDLYRQASEHSDELLREFALIRDREPGEGREVPRRLLTLIDDLRAQFTAFTTAQQTALTEAAARGDETIDLVYHVPPAVKAGATDLATMLDQADEFCRQGRELLTLAAPPHTVAFRRWFLDEFVRQVDGAEPTPWRGPIS